MLAAGSGAKIVNFLLYSGLVLRMACACVYVQRASSVDNILPWEDTGERSDTRQGTCPVFFARRFNWSFGEKEKFIFFLASGCEEGQVLLDCVVVLYMSLGGPPV